MKEKNDVTHNHLKIALKCMSLQSYTIMKNRRTPTYLVCDDDGDAELISDSRERTQELCKLLLPLRELTASSVVRAVQRRGGVDDEQRVAALAHHRARVNKQLGLMLAVVRSCERDVLEDVVRVHAVAAGDLLEALRSKAALRVDVQRLALTSAAIDGELARHAECVALGKIIFVLK